MITSGTGAAVRDIIHVATRRFPGCALEIVPVRVQGRGAEEEIARAIEQVNALERSDLIILARGGGSLEDLWAFNTEIVARAIFTSTIPVITGIGHETDFTIADFVSDLRAPTPSAAAEMALPDRDELLRTIITHERSLHSAMHRFVESLNQRLDDLASRLKSPDRVVREFRQRVNDGGFRLDAAMKQRFCRDRERLFWLRRTLDNALPRLGLTENRRQVQSLETRLTRAMEQVLQTGRSRIGELAASLAPLNPRAVLDRGYSITRKVDSGQVVLAADEVGSRDRLEIILSKGRLVTRVE